MAKFKSQLDSTRFVYIQEALAIGVLGSFAKVLFPNFPVIELYGFIGPVIMVAFGLKTYGDNKESEINLEREKTNGCKDK
ncbi:MAG: hypothetical protein WC455_22910 [Dehalococcoidia bacterium]|jgi:hypothetical protein